MAWFLQIGQSATLGTFSINTTCWKNDEKRVRRNKFVTTKKKEKRKNVASIPLFRAYHRSGKRSHYTNILKRHHLCISLASNKQELRIRATLTCPRTGFNMRQLSLPCNKPCAGIQTGYRETQVCRFTGAPRIISFGYVIRRILVRQLPPGLWNTTALT
jgi:hypothetical protein